MRKLTNFFIYRVPLVMPAILYFLHRVQYALLSFYKNPSDVALVRQVARERRMLLHPQEAFTLLALARMQAALDGDMAEVGVYRGASAKLICSAKGPRTFWGFDTFSGLQDVSSEDKHWGMSYFKSGQFAASQQEVADYLAPFDDVRLVPGYFPESAGDAAERRFSFVHLDVDTYASTLSSLRFFWPRMVAGGIIVTHDSHAQGVAKAVAEFLEESNARSFSTTCSQLAFVK
jgi:O-methyltransferase